jgi:hypothetical protein
VGFGSVFYERHRQITTCPHVVCVRLRASLALTRKKKKTRERIRVQPTHPCNSFFLLLLLLYKEDVTHDTDNRLSNQPTHTIKRKTHLNNMHLLNYHTLTG